jgi:4-hydroxythreonine-4-phosphate dehydrogenase
MSGKRIIAISCGDPGGIGPEVILAALPVVTKVARILIVGEKRYFDRAAGRVDIPVSTSPDEAVSKLATSSPILLEIKTPGNAPVGAPSKEGGAASIRYVEAALDVVISGKAQALVTGPISKEAVALAGYSYPGHTELLGERTGAKPVMMLAGKGLRFVLVTMHKALRDVPDTLSEDEIVRVAVTTAESLKRYFEIEKPRLAVMGLNPHASDGGRFGDEEKRIIAPAVEKIASLGWNVQGPLAPDTVPFRMLRGDFDVAVAMYHEQAALPVKTLAFDEGVNITLGLPIIRTSPDHGTAFDIAGRHEASPRSMIEAVKTAATMVRNSPTSSCLHG